MKATMNGPTNDSTERGGDTIVLGAARVVARSGPPQQLAVSGELDLTNAERFASLLRDADRPLVVDLGGVTYFDSSALRVVVTEHLGRPLSVIAPHGSIAR